jgi:ferrochelatase
MTRGILLINLGTPASASVGDVRTYLGEFLNDPHVIDLPWPLRQLVVRGFILPFRPARSAAAYASIWDSLGPGTGSPLLHYSKRLIARLQEAIDPMPCEIAMRYGSPGIEDAVSKLSAAGVDELLLIPLYPQHADSTRTTTVERVRQLLPDHMSLKVAPVFFNDPDYLRVQAAQLKRQLPDAWDHLLMSYHGLPERHLTTADPTGNHCLRSDDCCEVPSAAHATCYRHQVFSTSRHLMELLEIPDHRYSVSFQSRLGRLPWISPYTDVVLSELPGRGVRHLAVACPAFVADNLETLEEIGIAGKARFLDAGGESLHLIPCLNDNADWVEVLAGWSREPGNVVSEFPGNPS